GFSLLGSSVSASCLSPRSLWLKFLWRKLLATFSHYHHKNSLNIKKVVHSPDYASQAPQAQKYS
ncbi:hypothetical protein J4457_03235, partial [Candidatus Woesearchaeota archaeon]|nr:hypothetical protein [Candidatus Woesearchaeota archaeon]